MNERQLEIDVFLKKIANSEELKKYPYISEEYVYDLLENYGFTEEELKRGKNYKHYFEYWESNFQDKRNVRVFCSPQQKSFLQFHNTKSRDAEYMKLYVSLDSDNIFAGVDSIFRFLESQNIEHASKVSSKTRSDSIVLRIRKQEDVKKVLDFINTNPLLSTNCHPTNPFLMRHGVVGMAYDNNISQINQQQI